MDEGERERRGKALVYIAASDVIKHGLAHMLAAFRMNANLFCWPTRPSSLTYAYFADTSLYPLHLPTHSVQPFFSSLEHAELISNSEPLHLLCPQP